ncbi:expressed unknown protein [Seminavis robusta]|uniref:Uncharacterized protein n=1 Tax=Seminavis robusta TaxID=568900 RepID=A0A9N8DSZ8_9STRA|nr:expressed unknown protein [Seminavis robusta]|eukprot:Sro321_g116640.1 n/a (143) ;mRNA; r:7144-7836
MNRPTSTLGTNLSSLRLNTDLLWKVTLGFLPAYVNLHKRLYPEDDAPSPEETAPASKEIDVASDEAPELEWSDISSDSSVSSRSLSGWSKGSYEPETSGSASCASHPSDESSESSLAYSSTSTSTYGGSFYNFARPSWWKKS